MNYEIYTTVDWLMFFYIYCFLGWCFESTYVSLHQKKWVNRGFMRGPFLPLYGSGAVIMLFVTIPVRDNIFLTFLFGAIGATILEYFTGAAMEALFKVRYWDYSDQPLNLNGHICLGTSIAWGFLTLAMVHVLQLPVETVVNAIPQKPEGILVLVLSIYIAADFSLSFKAALDIKDVLTKMTAVREEMEKVQSRLDAIIAFTGQTAAVQTLSNSKDRLSGTLQAVKSKLDFLQKHEPAEGNRSGRQLTGFREELDQLKTRYIVDNEYRKALAERFGSFRKAMLEAHPTISSPKFQTALNELKEIISEKSHKEK